MPRALLVADEDVAYVLGVVERVVGGEDRSARDPEDGIRTHLLEGLHQGLGTGELTGDVHVGHLPYSCHCRTCQMLRPCYAEPPRPRKNPRRRKADEGACRW